MGYSQNDRLRMAALGKSGAVDSDGRKLLFRSFRVPSFRKAETRKPAPLPSRKSPNRGKTETLAHPRRQPASLRLRREFNEHSMVAIARSFLRSLRLACRAVERHRYSNE